MSSIDSNRPDPRRAGVADSSLEGKFFSESSRELARAVAERSQAVALLDKHGLQPLPAGITELMSLLQDPIGGVDRAKRLIEHDPVLAMHVIRAANSSFFSGISRVRSVQDAFVRMGPKRVLAVVAGAAALGVLNDKSGTAARVLQHCAAVADVATAIAQGGEGETTLAALVHDVGHLVILQVSPGLRARILEDGDHTSALEETVLGFDHAVLGEIILERWGFPSVVSVAVGMHHATSRMFENPGPSAVMAARIRLAEFIVRCTSGGVVLPFVDVMALPEAAVAAVDQRVIERILESGGVGSA